MGGLTPRGGGEGGVCVGGFFWGNMVVGWVGRVPHPPGSSSESMGGSPLKITPPRVFEWLSETLTMEQFHLWCAIISNCEHASHGLQAIRVLLCLHPGVAVFSRRSKPLAGWTAGYELTAVTPRVFFKPSGFKLHGGGPVDQWLGLCISCSEVCC